ncbi:hypothetical protein HGRIS_003947 [Hohenbuehelia grisea]|uniref:F-box domain-containing protein n=1 Tax=Hohenbuehelia grisea TaxID=104357 RepID=A0ABR3JI64_9AGAR
MSTEEKHTPALMPTPKSSITIDQLPGEILDHIFALSLPTKKDPNTFNPDLKKSPLLLGRVCRVWRERSLANHHLWTAIHVVVAPQDRESQHLDSRCEGISAWLGRSGSLPLSIILESSTQQADEALIPLLETVMPFAPRWKHFLVSFDTSSLQVFDHLSVDHSFSRLESLVIKYQWKFPNLLEDNFQLWSFHNARILTNAPCLRSVSLYHCTASNIAEHFSCLTQLTIDGFSHLDGAIALSILRRCPELRMCSLALADTAHSFTPNENSTETDSTDPVHLMHLARFRVKSSQMHPGYDEFFRGLILPNLTQFEFKSDLLHDLEALPFIPTLSESNCPLEELILVAPLDDDARLIKCLELVPTLQNLTITDTAGHGPSARPTLRDDALIRCLTVPPVKKVFHILCPQLRILRLQTGVFSPNAVMRMIKSRWRPVCKDVAELQHVAIRFESRAPAERATEEEFAVMRAEGLDLRTFHGVLWSTPLRHNTWGTWEDDDEDSSTPLERWNLRR